MIKHKSLQANTYKYWDKAHEKDPENYEYAKLIIYAPDEVDLHETTLTYINTLNYNGAWDLQKKAGPEGWDLDNIDILNFSDPVDGMSSYGTRPNLILRGRGMKRGGKLLS